MRSPTFALELRNANLGRHSGSFASLRRPLPEMTSKKAIIMISLILLLLWKQARRHHRRQRLIFEMFQQGNQIVNLLRPVAVAVGLCPLLPSIRLLVGLCPPAARRMFPPRLLLIRMRRGRQDVAET